MRGYNRYLLYLLEFLFTWIFVSAYDSVELSVDEAIFNVTGLFPLGFANIPEILFSNDTLRINSTSSLKLSRRAIENPDSASANFAAAMVEVILGKTQEAELSFRQSSILSNFTLSYAVYNYAHITHDTNEAVTFLQQAIEKVYEGFVPTDTIDLQRNFTYRGAPINSPLNSRASRSYWLHSLIIQKLYVSQNTSRQLKALLLATDMYPENRDNWIVLVNHLLRMFSMEIISTADGSGASTSSSAGEPMFADVRAKDLLFVMARGALVYPSDPGILYVLGLLHHRMKNDVCAIEFLRRSVRARGLVETEKEKLMMDYLAGEPSVVSHNLDVIINAYISNNRKDNNNNNSHQNSNNITDTTNSGEGIVIAGNINIASVPEPIPGQCVGLILPQEPIISLTYTDVLPELFASLDLSNLSSTIWFLLLMRKWHPLSSRIHPINSTDIPSSISLPPGNHNSELPSSYEEEQYNIWHSDYQHGNIKLQLGCNTFDCVARGWIQADAAPAAGTHFKVTAYDLSAFADGSVAVIYCSHMLEHLSQNEEKIRALAEWRRVLRYGGLVLISVPDLDVIAELLLLKNRFNTADRRILLDILYGGQNNAYDFHKSGFTEDVLADDLVRAGFCAPQRINNDFQLFADMSNLELVDRKISLSMVAHAC